MGCGLKKQNNTQSGVHLTERTCSPYNPIIKQIVDDCLGLPVYPITSIDAVIDENGTTLRQLLEDLLKELKDEINSRELVQRIELILETINSLDKTYATIEAVEDLENNLGNLKDWLLLVSSLEDIAPNELAEQVHPTIVAAVKQILRILGIAPGTEETNLILELANVKALVEEIGKCGNGDLRNPANSVVWIVDYVRNILEGGEFAHLNPQTSQLREDEYPVTSAYFIKDSKDFSTFMSELLSNLGVNQSVYAYFYKNVPYGISPKSSPALYDFNGNNVTDFGDVALLILNIKGRGYLAINEVSADVNNDGSVNIGDVNDLTGYILAHWDDPNFETYITSSDSAGFIFQFTRRVISDSLVTNLSANTNVRDVEQIFSNVNGLELKKYPLIDGKIYSDLYQDKTYRYNANSKTMVQLHKIKSLDPSIIIELDEDDTVVYTVQLPGSSVLFVKELGIITNPITEEEETREVVHVDINPATFFSPDGTVTISGFNENHQIELSIDLSDVVESSSNTISVDSYSNDRIDINVNLDELVKSTNETIDIDTTGDKIDLGINPIVCSSNRLQVGDYFLQRKSLQIMPFMLGGSGVFVGPYDPNTVRNNTNLFKYAKNWYENIHGANSFSTDVFEELQLPGEDLEDFVVTKEIVETVVTLYLLLGFPPVDLNNIDDDLSEQLLTDKRQQLLDLYDKIDALQFSENETKEYILDTLINIGDFDVTDGVTLNPISGNVKEYLETHANVNINGDHGISDIVIAGISPDTKICVCVKNNSGNTYHLEEVTASTLQRYMNKAFDYANDGEFNTLDILELAKYFLNADYITYNDISPIEINSNFKLNRVTEISLDESNNEYVSGYTLVTDLKTGSCVYNMANQLLYAVVAGQSGEVMPQVDLKLSNYIMDNKLILLLTNNDVVVSRTELPSVLQS